MKEEKPVMLYTRENSSKFRTNQENYSSMRRWRNLELDLDRDLGLFKALENTILRIPLEGLLDATINHLQDFEWPAQFLAFSH